MNEWMHDLMNGWMNDKKVYFWDEWMYVWMKEIRHFCLFWYWAQKLCELTHADL